MTKQYTCVCGEFLNEKKVDTFSMKDKETFIAKVFAGTYSVSNLPKFIYKTTAKKLMEGVFKGWGKDFQAKLFTAIDQEFLAAFHHNIYAFSGAKTYQQTKEANAALLNEKGERVFYPEFKQKAAAIFDDYNENYLKTEYNFAIGKSRAAANWGRYQADKETFPVLVYKTVADGRVRAEHEALDNIALPVNNPFWDTYLPPWEPNCRCDVNQATEDMPATDISKMDLPPSDPVWGFNAGKKQMIFSEKHPYFSVAHGDKGFAKQNFNLEIPEP